MTTPDAEYQAEYARATAELEAAAQATTARGPDGKFTAAQPAGDPTQLPVAAPAQDPAATGAPAAAGAQADPPKPDEVDPIAQLTARVEKAEKIARDNQAWATRAAQEAAALRRQQEAQQRAANKPAILDANPELADAIRYVATDPAPEQQQAEQRVQFQQVIEKVHPDAFAADMPKELQDAIASRWDGLGNAAQDPLEIVRVITEEKLAYGERQVGKRFAAEAAKLAQKSAMSVPGAGASSVAAAPADAQLAEVQRIQSMSDADFQKEVRRVRGY